jgi:HD domain
MSSKARGGHPTIDVALILARKWCAGHVVGEAPALAHAVKVAATLRRHVPDADPQLVAAVLLHDSPEFAPPGVDLDAVLAELGPQVPRIVRALHAEHAGLDPAGGVPFDPADRWVWCASAADKIVALLSMLRRAAKSGDAAAFWARRSAFIDALPYFWAFYEAARLRLPQGMAAELGQLIAVAWQAPPGLVVKVGHGPGVRVWWAPWRHRCRCRALRWPCPDGMVHITLEPAYWLGMPGRA